MDVLKESWGKAKKTLDKEIADLGVGRVLMIWINGNETVLEMVSRLSEQVRTGHVALVQEILKVERSPAVSKRNPKTK